MRTNLLKSILNAAVLVTSTLLLGAVGTLGQQQINLSAGPTSAILPDGSSIPMWGYSCGAVVTGSTATCVALNPAAAAIGAWSPVVITVQTGQDLQINLTNNLTFAPTGGGTTNSIPTSLVIVGQLGGGLGDASQRTVTPSPTHDNQPTTWPIANSGPVFTPPSQGPRVQSFSTEVQAGSGASLKWTAPRPGTYLIESGTHPSIQGPMGLYGMLVVTSAPPNALSPFTAYPNVTYNADSRLLFSEIDPAQNKAADAAVKSAGFSEASTLGPFLGGPIVSIYLTSGGSGYTSAPSVSFSGSGGAAATAVIDTDPSSPTYKQVTEIDLDPNNAGSYTTAPTVIISGGGGSGASATAALQLNGNPLGHCSGGASACYPPAVNFTPLYYLINGVGFNKTNASASMFPTFPASVLGANGKVLVRMVNAGLHMHVPAIVGSQTGSPATPGFSLIAEDGNPLPGIPRVQNEVFMAAGKTYDVLINAPASGSTALPVFDRELSLSGNATARDAGMLAYISANGAPLPAAGSLGAAVANADTYSVVPGNMLAVADPSKGVIANDVNVYGVQISAMPVHGTLALNANGTFTYTPDSSWTSSSSDSFVYQANGTGPTATVSLTAASIEGQSGIIVNNITYTSNVATTLSIKPPGILSVDKDNKGYPLIVDTATVAAGSGLTLTVDPNGGFNATVTAPGMYTFTYKAKNSQGTQSASSATVTLNFPTPSGLSVTVLDGQDKKTPLSDYRWIIEEDRTFYIDPNCTANPPAAGCPTAGSGIVPTFGTNFHTSYMPVVATGCTGDLSCESGQSVQGIPAVCDIGNGICRTDAKKEAALDPSQVHLDPTKHYYISVLPGDAANPFNTGNAVGGHGMGGAPINAGQKTVMVMTQPTPFQTAKLSVFVFEDDFPLNGEHDAGGGIDVLATNEPGLGGFNITLFDDAGGTGDATGQMTYDMFNMPLSNSLAGTPDPATGNDACPISTNSRVGSDGTTISPTGITGTIVTCPIYESDGRTLSPLAGQAVVANMMPGRYGVVATPGADRIARGEEWLQTNTLDGQKAHDSFLRVGEPVYFQEYGPAGYHVTIGFANPKIINGRKAAVCNGKDPNITGSNCTNSIKGTVTTERMSRTPDERLYSSGSNDSFAFTQCYVSFGDPDGEDFAFTKCNSDGTFALSGLPDGDWRVTVFDQWNDMLVDGLSTPVRLGGGATTDMHDIAMNQWQANIYTSSFFDQNKDGVRQQNEAGLSLVPTNIRFRDGSFSNFNNTDLSGNAGFNEVFPLFSWYVVEADTTRYKNTGTHVVYDAGGPADGTCTGATAPCGTSTIGQNMANTKELVSVPTTLRIPGAVYCDNADCSGFSIANGPGSSANSNLSTGRIDPPWVLTEGWQGFSGQNSFVEFGKTPYVPGETGGIKGHVVYASTRPFDDPQLLLQLSWEPLVPNVTINLYQEGTADDGTTSLKLVDSTKTSSFDDWAQGFRSDGVPNMNCPGQFTDSGANTDLFFFTLYNQPMWLDFYNNVLHGTGSTPATLPNNSQFKCYDGMHNWNQVQPAPYDGLYQFPSIADRNPQTGAPVGGTGSVTGTNCTICVANPTDGTPMLPAGKYVVEVVVPPGYELVKEEDKNILIGDNYIAPVTQEFAGLGNVFILPDQATIGSSTNPNNPQNSTQNLGSFNFPRHEGDTGSVETFWPCVGASRIVPDFISLYPQSQEVAPFAGATRNLCDRKEVTLEDQSQALAKFYVFTSTHVAAHFTGVITDDYTSEFDPFSPQFGEKFSPPDLPISIKDWTGTEISRVYSDQWGTYNGLTYSTWEVNPPNPTGYAPTMMVTCMNDPGNGVTPDPLFNPQYSQFCYEIPFMPGQTQYMDTPVVPTSAFAGAGYNNPDCAYPSTTPAIKQVNGDVTGPWVAGASGSVASIAVTNGGANYTGIPNVSLSGGGGTGAAATAVIEGGVASVTVSNGGRGYTVAPAVVFTGGNGFGATATANVSGMVAGITVTAAGSGYRTNPTVTITGGGGTGARATATINTRTGRVTSIRVTNAGSGYTSVPTVSFSGGGGSGAKATASLTESVTSVTVTNAGKGYTTAPTVTFGDAPLNGASATATAHIAAVVTYVNLTNQGSGYTSAPSVSFSGGGGSGAAATATVEPTTGGTLVITALGDVNVPNNGYSGPSVSTAPYNQKSVSRHYGFGSTPGTVTIGGVNAPVTSGNWSDQQITVTVPNNVPLCTVQQLPQYGSTSPARCGELVITAADGKQSIDAVTVTVGGKKPNAFPGTIQGAIDAAAPGDLIIVPPGVYNELVLMWKPVRLQGVGAASTVINANTQPAGRLDPWRQKVACLFGLALNGQPYSTVGNQVPIPGGGAYQPVNPYDPSGATSCPATGWNYFTGSPNNPQVDRLPLEGVVGWDTTVNGNLAELLQEPSLMGAYEGAGITVLSKGVRYPAGVEIFGSGQDTAAGSNIAHESQMPLGTNELTNSASDCNDYPSNFQCNPSRIDGLSITDSSQGGGGIFIHAWGHNLEIANNRIYNNAGTSSGGINVGQGESPDALLTGNGGDPLAPTGGFDQQPWTCVPGAINRDGSQNPNPPGFLNNQQLPYCYNLNVNIHHNSITGNSSVGDELFSATPAGAGGVTFCTGADYYKFNYNWLCGNLSSGDGGGLAHLGFSYDGDIEHNTILFNQSTNPTIPTNGGGIIVMGAAPDGTPPGAAPGTECGSVTDVDCAPGLSDGTGPGLVINANLIMGNAADSGSGGGLRLQSVNGTEVGFFPTSPNLWYSVSVTNNIIANNVAGWDGGGVSLQDALVANIINNTIMSNDTTASSGVLFNTLGAPDASAPGDSNQSTSTTTSAPQAAGLVSMQNSSLLTSSLPSRVICPSGHYTTNSATNGNCRSYSVPILYNDVFWQNRAFYIGVGALGSGTLSQQNVVALYNALTTTPAVSQPQADASTANGAGVLITGGTGACVSPASYWDIGVRGDKGPSNHASTLILNPQYSVLTDASDYAGRNNTGANPTVLSQYCNGSRIPPELGTAGYQVPPGISDATVPNPIFNLTPAATVDEGNNWINISWGPLAETNPATGALLGNYGPAAGSSVINYIPSTAPTYGAAPSLDFYGTARKTNHSVDAGAVEFVAPAGPAASVSGGPLAFGGVPVGTTSATQTLTLQNTGTVDLTGITVVVTAPFNRVGGSCGTTLTVATGACTITVSFTPTALGSATGTATITTTTVAVTGSPVSLTGTGVTPATVGITPNPLTITVATPIGNLGSGTGTVTLTNTAAAGGASVTITNVSINSGTGSGALAWFFNGVAGADNCTGATLAPGATCTVGVRFTNVGSATGVNRPGTITFTDNATGSPQTGNLVGHANP